MTINHLTATLLALAGFALLLRQILLSSDSDTFPCAPTFVQIAMFIAGVVCIGTSFLFWGAPGPYAGAASTAVAVLIGVMLLYHSVMLLNVLSQRRPATVWRRLRAIWARTCRPQRVRA